MLRKRRMAHSRRAPIDTASKTGTEHDATAVTFFAQDSHGGRFPLMILDWDIVQIQGALLETWLPTIFERLEELSKICRARYGSIGALIEDKNSGTILLQQALRRQMPAREIDSKLTAMGKDERAISVSGYVYRGNVKYTDCAFNKVTTYKRRSKNHLVDQVESFRVGDKDNKREDDLLDTFCYGTGREYDKSPYVSLVECVASRFRRFAGDGRRVQAALPASWPPLAHCSPQRL
jgi:phage terminase large subunit-like protein